jgi:hypothetical protein
MMRLYSVIDGKPFYLLLATIQTLGSKKQFEARMADPQFQAKVLEKVRGDAPKRPAVTSLPPSLSKATAAAGNREEPLGDMSDASLFAYAMRPKGPRSR